VAERFSDPAVQISIETDLGLIGFYDTLLNLARAVYFMLRRESL
jgi:hypothetical protein